jgi:tRNA (cmo5U34)-methyltransferase
MDKIKNHFEQEAQEFDRIILELLPHYQAMVQALVKAIPFERSRAVRVIDLGCGTGMVTAKVLESFPSAHVTCLDVAENMIASARVRLAHTRR